jgi:hypothetical protein
MPKIDEFNMSETAAEALAEAHDDKRLITALANAYPKLMIDHDRIGDVSERIKGWNRAVLAVGEALFCDGDDYLKQVLKRVEEISTHSLTGWITRDKQQMRGLKDEDEE